MATSERASVSTRELEVLRRAVEWANFLSADTAGAQPDPCCMLEALSDVYDAARHLVHESNQWKGHLAPGSAL